MDTPAQVAERVFLDVATSPRMSHAEIAIRASRAILGLTREAGVAEDGPDEARMLSEFYGRWDELAVRTVPIAGR